MKVTLQVNGREVIFTEVESISIFEEKPESEDAKPTEEKWFRVTPLAIDQNLFKKERSDTRQEDTRQLILEAFEEMQNE